MEVIQMNMIHITIHVCLAIPSVKHVLGLQIQVAHHATALCISIFIQSIKQIMDCVIVRMDILKVKKIAYVN